MYQPEVKRYVVEYLFPRVHGWNVVVDLDGMEMGKGGGQCSEKQERAAACVSWFREHGVEIGWDKQFGRRDIVARHPQHGTVLVEVEGESSRQREQALYSALGQAVLQMLGATANLSFAIAVPDSEKWEDQLRKVPQPVRNLLNLRLYLASPTGVREM